MKRRELLIRVTQEDDLFLVVACGHSENYYNKNADLTKKQAHIQAKTELDRFMRGRNNGKEKRT